MTRQMSNVSVISC